MLKPFFKPSQIVCLEHQNNYLYGEVIQIIESRQLCWMRPLMLAVFANDIPTVNSLQEAEELWDVRLTSDVAYPLPGNVLNLWIVFLESSQFTRCDWS
jgi:hypothetical protein